MNYVKRLYNGRISRKNYGLGLLFFICSFILLIVVAVLMFSSVNSLYYIFAAILYVAFIVHIFSLHARRFHDRGDSGWYVLLLFIPLVNLVMLILLLTTKGKDDTNKFGEAPSKSLKFFDAILNRNPSSLVSIDKEKNSIQYCAKCGAQIESGSKFCFKCGAKIAFNE